jgi:accessory colonization factor AcfC
VRDSDRESDVEKAKGRYPQAQFIENSPEWVNSHAGPDELFYSDNKNNLEIVFQKSAKKVSAIRWEFSDSKLKLIRKPSSKAKF